MRALTVIPEKPGSAAVIDVGEPGPEQGDVLVDALAIGVCGTDREIIAGDYGQAPAGRERLVCSGTRRSASSRRRPRPATSRPATSSSGSSAVPTRSPATPAPGANSTCVETG